MSLYFSSSSLEVDVLKSKKDKKKKTVSAAIWFTKTNTQLMNVVTLNAVIFLYLRDGRDKKTDKQTSRQTSSHAQNRQKGKNI